MSVYPIQTRMVEILRPGTWYSANRGARLFEMTPGGAASYFNKLVLLGHMERKKRRRRSDKRLVFMWRLIEADLEAEAQANRTRGALDPLGLLGRRMFLLTADRAIDAPELYYEKGVEPRPPRCWGTQYGAVYKYMREQVVPNGYARVFGEEDNENGPRSWQIDADGRAIGQEWAAANSEEAARILEKIAEDEAVVSGNDVEDNNSDDAFEDVENPSPPAMSFALPDVYHCDDELIHGIVEVLVDDAGNDEALAIRSEQFVGTEQGVLIEHYSGALQLSLFGHEGESPIVVRLATKPAKAEKV